MYRCIFTFFKAEVIWFFGFNIFFFQISFLFIPTTFQATIDYWLFMIWCFLKHFFQSDRSDHKSSTKFQIDWKSLILLILKHVFALFTRALLPAQDIRYRDYYFSYIFPLSERTSRDRPKSAPYPRLKNSKRTSKCQVFSLTVLENRKFFEKITYSKKWTEWRAGAR